MKKFIKSLNHALHGIRMFFLQERNGMIQLTVAALAGLLGFLFAISAHQWLIILFCIGLVLSLEMLNSALEKLCNLVSKDLHPGIKAIKDVAAGAVLVASVFSLIAGLIIFIPELINFFNRK
jgi:diacylglycerol kinase